MPSLQRFDWWWLSLPKPRLFFPFFCLDAKEAKDQG
jgi:hypothetical protein